jgi:hypothetical protein
MPNHYVGDLLLRDVGFRVTHLRPSPMLAQLFIPPDSVDV